MKKYLLAFILLALLATSAQAVMSDMKILAKDEIAKLTNEKLIDVYIETKVEIAASKTFYCNSGFSTLKEYDKYKELLTYVIYLQQEMQKKGVIPPPVDEWIR